MNVSLSTMWWGEGTDVVEEQVDCTRDLGFTQVELEYRRPAAIFPRLRKAMARAGLAVSSLHAPFPRPVGKHPLRQADLAAEDAGARRRAVDLVARTLEEAAHWGARVVVLHGGNIEALRSLEDRLRDLYGTNRTEDGDFRRLQKELRQRRAVEAPRYLEWVREALAELVPLARSIGVVIALENRAHFRDLPSLEEMGQLLEEFGPAVGYWHDVGHAFRLEILGFYPHEAWLHAHGARLVGIHLHDSVGLKDHQPPGRGKVSFGALAPLFPVQGLRVIEVRCGHSGQEIVAGLAHLRATGVLP